MMTNQEFFTRSLLHILQQKERSVNDVEQCAYAGVNGGACALGVHMPRELAEECDRDDEPEIYALIQVNAQVNALFAGLSLQLLKSMQRLHDRYKKT